MIFLFALRAISAEGWSFSKLRKRFLLVPLLLLGLVSSPVFDRFEELSREGSSGYARVIAPLILAKDAVISPMGIEALGFRSFNDRAVFSQMEGRVERAGIANSFLEFIIYFGATGVLILVTAMGSLSVVGIDGRFESVLQLVSVAMGLCLEGTSLTPLHLCHSSFFGLPAKVKCPQ